MCLQPKVAMVEAYVLIQTEQGRMAEVVQLVSEIEGVNEADIVTGPYDVIARVAADDIDTLGKLIVSQVQTVGGVVRTLTCPVVQL
jgi:DNA-binding Lrp family transcriptional regulator